MGELLQCFLPLLHAARLQVAQQVAAGTVLVDALIAIAVAQRSQTQPHQMACACECHVEQAQVFAQAFFVGLGQLIGAEVQAQRAIAQAHPCGVLAIFFCEAAAKRQHDDGVLQPLAFVDGDDLHQIGIAFQPQGLRFAVLAGVGNVLGQPANQRLFSLQRGAGVLQQLGQMQVIGQGALAFAAVGLSQPARGQLEAVQAGAQHGQNALALPQQVQLAQQQGVGVQQLIVLRQTLQLGQRQGQQAGGQCRAHGPGVEGLCNGLEPVQQVLRLRAFKHGGALRQVDRGHAPALQLVAHGLCFSAAAHQYRDVARAQAGQGPIGGLKAHAGVIEPADDALGARLCVGVHQGVFVECTGRTVPVKTVVPVDLHGR